MNLHTSTRILIDDEYAALVGKAVYSFSYYEWSIIWIIEKIQNGYVQLYSRGKPLTSGNVEKKLKSLVDLNLVQNNEDVKNIHSEFKRLIVRRNALIHAHPCTDINGNQILNYQTESSRELPDMKWPKEEVELLIKEIDLAEIQAAKILDLLR